MATYYISNTGDDGLAGTTEGTAWETIAKVNAMAGTFVAGDSILFRRNDTFVGSITVTISGTSGNHITYGAYGDGERPIISGRISVGAWTNQGSNIWTATNVGTSTVNRLFKNDINQTLARFPKYTAANKGYKTYTANTASSITDLTLPDSPSFVGAECVVRTNTYSLRVVPVQSQSSGLITFTTPTADSPDNGEGYFFQNHINCLTQNGEWIYNDTTKVITIYSTTDPNSQNWEINGYDRCFDLLNKHYLTIENIHFDGFALDAIYHKDGTYKFIQYNKFTNSGLRAAYNWVEDWCKFNYNIVDGSLQHGLLSYGNSVASADNCEIIGNTALNIGFPIGQNRLNTGSNSGLTVFGDSCVVTDNLIDNVAYIGINWRGGGVQILRNIVRNFCTELEDGGGIYSWNGNGDSSVTVQSLISKNIVYNGGFGSEFGSVLNGEAGYGIYNDWNSNNVAIEDNVCYNIQGIGVFFNNSELLKYRRNISFGNTEGAFFFYHAVYGAKSGEGCEYTDNQWFGTSTVAQNFRVVAISNEFLSSTMDGNYYINPYGGNWTINCWYNNSATDGEPQTVEHYTLAQWKAAHPALDINSKNSPITLTTEDWTEYLVLKTNETASPIQVHLTAAYVDKDNVAVASPITIPAYSGVTLFKTGEEPLVVADYYMSDSDGNDDDDGLTPATAWKTMTKLQAMNTSITAGKKVAFKRGDTFRGQYIPTASGTAGNPIIFTPYGTGEKPIITGTIVQTGWTSIGGNRWTKTYGGTNNVTELFINGVAQIVGRFPKATDTYKGYYKVDSFTSTTITASELVQGQNWEGAELVIRNVTWVFDIGRITNHTGTTFTVDRTNMDYPFVANVGFFMQHKAEACTVHGEWSFDKVSKVITLYSTTDPNLDTIEVTGYDRLFDLTTNKDYYTFDSLHLRGTSYALVYINYADNIVIQNCELSDAMKGIHLFNGIGTNVLNNHIHHLRSNVIWSNQINTNTTVNDNLIHDIANVAGMGTSGVGENSTLNVNGNGFTCYRNIILDVGYLAIGWRGDAAMIKWNYINNFCSTLDDGSAIYTYDGDSSSSHVIQNEIMYNTVLNGIGAPEGTVNDLAGANGIYFDDGSENNKCWYNTVNNVATIGIFWHNADDIDVQYNTVRNTNTTLWMYDDGLHVNRCVDSIISYNKVVLLSTATDDYLWWSLSGGTSVAITQNTFDYNTYSSPYYLAGRFKPNYDDGGGMQWASYSFVDWQSTFSKDLNSSLKNPITLTTEDKDEYVPIFYNETDTAKTFNLTASYVDIDGFEVASPLTVQPYSAEILFKTGELPTPPPSYDEFKILLTPNAYKAGKLYTFKPININSFASVVRAGTSTRFNENGFLEDVAVNVPRIDYANGGCPCILVEPTAVNTMPNNNSFTAASGWTLYKENISIAPVVTPNYALSIDGTMNASRIVFDLGGMNDPLLISQMHRLPDYALGTGSVSVWLKSTNGTTQKIYMRPNQINTREVYEVGAEWTRISRSGITVSSYVELGLRGNVTLDVQTADILICFWQNEDQPLPTSIIKTGASAVTRNADVITIPTIAGTTEIIESIDGAEGVPITTIPGTYQLPVGRIDYIKMI